jgi:hypothetical protein
MMKFVALIIFVVVAASIQASEPVKHTYTPDYGFVPDKATAVVIALAVLTSIYGDAQTKSQLPYIATLDDGVWTVTGTLPAGLKGGVAVVEISESTGKIMTVSHGK